MPSWKPDCLKASATLNQISHTIQSAKLLQGTFMLFIDLIFFLYITRIKKSFC